MFWITIRVKIYRLLPLPMPITGNCLRVSHISHKLARLLELVRIIDGSKVLVSDYLGVTIESCVGYSDVFLEVGGRRGS